MRNSPDPSVHQQLERQMMAHVEQLLGDERLRVDTTRGRRPVTTLFRNIEQGDHGVDLKRLMVEMGKPDRDLQAKMPVGTWMEITLSQKKLFIFKETVGRLHVICFSPARSLIAGESPEPLSLSDTQKILTEMSMSSRGSSVPSTVVLVSTSGFAPEVNDLAERRADRTLILAQPNESGGWKVTGPTETQSLVDLFDPEALEQKRLRIRKFITENETDLLSGGGIAGDRVAAKTELPLQLVEAELKSYAKDKPGLQAKRLDGRIVLFREGVSGTSPEAPGEPMGIIDRVKALFRKKGDDTQKIAHLSERRAALLQQQERIYEQLNSLEAKEQDLRKQFQQSNSSLTKRRLTTQLLMLHKDIERLQQMVSMIGSQVSIIATDLHNLEVARQGTGGRLPSSEEIAENAAKAEEILAQLQADTEVAHSTGAVASSGLSDEEQALFEELEREAAEQKKAAQPEPEKPASEKPQTAPPVTQRTTPTPAEPATPVAEPSVEEEIEPPALPPTRNTQRSQPEPG